MKKIALGLIAATLALTGLVVTLTPAQATTSASTCSPGWYVNPDETSLTPVQKDGGLLFDGPSLVHHATSGPLAEAATDSSFVATVTTGAAPLFKFETSKPYSTINKTAAGLYWSSKIASGVGSQASPTTLAILAATAPYTEATVLISFGVGYANDAGNAATVKSVTYAKITYSFVCVPPVTSTTPTTKSSTPSSTPTTKTTAPSSTRSEVVVLPSESTSFSTVVARPVSHEENLASTGAGIEPGWLVLGGVGLLLLGGSALLIARSRRKLRRD